MASEKEIKKKDLEAELTNLRAEIDIESKRLTEILKQQNGLAAERKAFELEKADFEAFKKKIAEDFRLKRDELNQASLAHASEMEGKKATLKSLSQEVKEANHELAWVNAKILSGNEELDSLVEKKLTIENEIAKIEPLSVTVVQLQNAVVDLVAKKQKLEVECVEKIASEDVILAEKKKKLEKVVQELKEAEKNRDKVQYEYKTYSDSLYTAMNDYQIIKSRLEVRFKEHYPELELPLAV